MSAEDKWDTGNFEAEVEPKPASIISMSQWDGEDEEEDVKDSWDDPEEEDKEKTKEDSTPKTGQVLKSKKKLQEKIEEKERKAQEELLMKQLERETAEMTPEEIQEEKLMRQKLQEEADFLVAKEMLGADSPCNDYLPALETKEDFEKFKDDLVRQVGDATKNQNFPDFVDQLIQSFCVHLSATDLKKIHTWIGNLQIEKNKLEQGTKSKKKGKGKAKLKIDDGSDMYCYNEDVYDDFM